MKFSLVIKDKNKAYLGTLLWLPKKFINSIRIKTALEFEVYGKDGQNFLQLWEETPNHIGVPREFIPPEEYKNLSFPIINLSPSSFPRVNLKSKVVLDKLDPSKNTQRRAYKAFCGAQNGLLNLACLSGDTKISVNRAKKGFTCTLRHAYQCFHGISKNRNWRKDIPTYVRTNKDGIIKLHEIRNIIYKGKKLTFRVTLENGNFLCATKDHKILTERGWVQVQNLSIKDLVFVDDYKLKTAHEKKRVYRRLSWYPSHPFARKQVSIDRVNYIIEEHRVVAEAELNDISFKEFRQRCKEGKVEGLKFIDPSVFHVHHIDGNHCNNSPVNLKIIEKSEHNKLHGNYINFGYGIPTLVPIKNIQRWKFEDVYDVKCKPPYHNFVANGIVVHNCGGGKTTIALHAIARMGLNTLIIVNQKTILSQWEGAIRNFLEFKGSIGLIQGKIWDWKHPITIAMLHSLARHPDKVSIEIRRWFGVVIWDEIHHLSAPYFCVTATMFPGRRYGLTATAKREDGTEVVYNYHVGDVFYKDLYQEVKPTIIFRQTQFLISPEDFIEFVLDISGQPNMGKLRTYMGSLEERNEFIAIGLRDALSSGRKILALSHSKIQLKKMYEKLSKEGIDTGICTGDEKVVERWAALRDKRLIFGTHQLVMEAIDEDSLDTLFWLTPFGSQHPDGGKNALQQGMGRIQGYRFKEGMKQPMVVIYDDIYVKYFHRMCNVLRKQLRSWPVDEGGPYKYTDLPPY